MAERLMLRIKLAVALFLINMRFRSRMVALTSIADLPESSTDALVSVSGTFQANSWPFTVLGVFRNVF